MRYFPLLHSQASSGAVQRKHFLYIHNIEPCSPLVRPPQQRCPLLRPQHHLPSGILGSRAKQSLLWKSFPNIVYHVSSPQVISGYLSVPSVVCMTKKLIHVSTNHQKWIAVRTTVVCAARFVAVVYWLLPPARA